MKKFFKGFIMSVVTLAVGYAALAFPFHLFTELSSEGMQLLFIAECVIYLFMGMAYIFHKQKKKERKIKEKEKVLERRAKFQKAQQEYFSLAA